MATLIGMDSVAMSISNSLDCVKLLTDVTADTAPSLPPPYDPCFTESVLALVQTISHKMITNPITRSFAILP